MHEGGELTPTLAYWGERETREWCKKLREEKEKVERERIERIGWRMREMQRMEPREDCGRWGTPPGMVTGWTFEMRTPSPYWRGRRNYY